MKRFILIVDDATPDEQNIITNHYKGSHVGFWHYFTDVWCIIDPFDQLTTNAIRDVVHSLLPSKSLLVLPVESGTDWAGFGPSPEFVWMRKQWPALSQSKPPSEAVHKPLPGTHLPGLGFYKPRSNPPALG